MTEKCTPDLNPDAHALLEFWQEARGKNILPARSVLDPIRLKKWINNLSVVEFRSAEDRYFVRLHSQNTQDEIGQNMTRKYFDEVLDPEVLPVAIAPYEAARLSRKPTHSVMTSQLYTGLFKHLERLVLPFTDEISPGADAPADRFLTWVSPTRTEAKGQNPVYVIAQGKQSSDLNELISLTFPEV